MSLKVKVTDQKGAQLHDIELNEDVFGIEPNQQAMFDAVIMQQASLRQGTHKTKGRSEVRGANKNLGVKKELVVQDMVQEKLHNLLVVEWCLDQLQEAINIELTVRLLGYL